MGWMNSIISWLSSLEGYFYDAYLEVYGWVYPFWLLSYPLLYASRGFGWLAYYFSLFNNWLVWANGELGKILSWDTIWSDILSYVPKLTQIQDWFYSWAANVQGVVSTWWSTTQSTVQGWITAAVQPFNTMVTAWNDFWDNLWPALESRVDGLSSVWGNFLWVTLPTLVRLTWLTTWWNSRLTDVQGLIDSAFSTRDSLWSGWQDMRAKVIEFFANPVTYIWERFADWFLGPEE